MRISTLKYSFPSIYGKDEAEEKKAKELREWFIEQDFSRWMDIDDAIFDIERENYPRSLSMDLLEECGYLFELNEAELSCLFDKYAKPIIRKIEAWKVRNGRS